MVKKAETRKAKYQDRHIEVLRENVFQNSIETESADCVISGFGLKTFNEAQLDQLAQEIGRILKPGGRFSLIDVSIPRNSVLKGFYMFYLKRVIPVLGKLFLGNPETYRMLGVYTEAFQNARQVEAIFRRHNFNVQYVEYFFGCASGIKGWKVS